LPGFDDLTLSQFLDVVWADAWDDVGGFTDRHRYREAIHHILILGEDPPTYDDDDDGSTKKSKRPRRTPGKSDMNAQLAKARALRERGMKKAAESAE
jgi:hypothetical protein